MQNYKNTAMPDPEDSSRDLVPRKGGELIRRMDRRVELANRVVGEIQAKQDLKRIDLAVAQRFLNNPHPDTAGGTIREHLDPSAGAVSLVEHQLLDDDAAEVLSKGKIRWLCLNGLTKLSDAAAESLSKLEEDKLKLNSLSEESRAKLEKYRDARS